MKWVIFFIILIGIGGIFLQLQVWRASSLRPFFFVMQKGDDIFPTLLDAFAKKGGKSWSISGLGAVKDPVIAYYNLETKEYEKKEFLGIFEVASLNGNVTFLKGKPMAHIHVVLGDEEHKAFAGHLVEGVVGVTLELTVVPIDHKHTRAMNSEVQLNLIEPQK